jgi:uncharacterized membrane protein
MSDRTVPLDTDAKCDICGKQGAYDFMGDYYCLECTSKLISSEACNRCGCNPCECEE